MREKDSPVSDEFLQRMVQALSHRGPDDQGYYREPGMGLGFARLSIIDLSSGNQPHFSEDESLVSLCNGEIYNYQEIRKSLIQRGHSLRTHCDVEVLVHLYEDHGTDFIRDLNGQFAFCIYDRRKRELILARDHVGIAPLFYTVTADAVIFASEIKALLAFPGIKRHVDLTGLDQILTFPGLISPTTLFQGIHSVKPGHLIRIRDGQVTEQEYWDLNFPEMWELDKKPDEAFYARQLEEYLERSVRLRLVADVPVGFYLSGGLDSSLIASLIHKISPQERRHSFSIAFTQPEIDERRYQQLMADQVGSLHHETEFGWQDISDRLQNVIYHTECPLKESYDTCSLMLSRLVRQTGLKVVLTGEGSDELFAGYVGYRLDETGTARPEELSDVELLLEQEIRERLWGDADFFYEKNYIEWREIKSSLYSPGVNERLNHFESTREPFVDLKKLQARHPIHKRSYLDFKLRMADHLLSDHGDRVAYANSVEARYPFLDKELIDFAVTIPPQLLVKNAQEKYILRRVAQSYLPEEIVKREKFGFVAPGSPYLLRRNLEWVNDRLSRETIRRQGYFNPDTVERLKKMYTQGNAAINTTFETDLLMIVLTFGIFLDTFQLPSYS